MAERTRIQTEKEHNTQAFEVYYALGPKRSHSAVAKKLGVSVSTIKNWSRSFRWQERIAERDTQVAREVASRTLNTEVARTQRSLQIVQMSIVQLAKAISQGKVKMTMQDLDRLLRLEMFLTDQPDSRQEVVFADLRNKTTGELKAMVREEIEMLKEFDVNDQEIEVLERDGKLLSSSLSVPRSNSDSG